jgi:hypothetical protein
MNNQRVTRSKSLLALEMAFIGLLAWVVFSSLIAWQSNTVQAGNLGAGQQIQRPETQVTQGLPDGRFVPPEGPSPHSGRTPLAGTANACTSFDFETGAQGFTVVPDIGTGVVTPLWHLDNALCRAFLMGHTTPFTFYYGQDSTCNYNTGARNASSLVSPAINLSGTFAPFSLGFNYLLFVEGGGFDTTFVDISTNGGTTWTQVLSKANLINDNQWHNKAADVTAVVGAATSVRVRFRFDSIDNIANSTTGWHVDDVLVCGQPFNFCVQDNNTGDYIQFNSVTGVYVTKQCSTGFTAQGVGTVTTNGSTITLTQKGPNNFNTVTVDTSTHTGSAAIRVQMGLKIVAYNISDSNYLNNTCVCP